MTAARRPSLSFLLIMEINGRLRIKSCALMLQPGLRAASRPVIQALGYVGRRSEQAATAGTRCRCMGGREGEREEEGGRCVWGEGIGSERVRGGYRKKRRREERQRAMRWREESCPQIDPQQHQTASTSPSSFYLPLSLSPSISLYLSSLARSLTRSLLRNRLKKGKKTTQQSVARTLKHPLMEGSVRNPELHQTGRDHSEAERTEVVCCLCF